MSKPGFTNSSFNFIGHDGADANGVQAEVRVQSNSGVVHEIRVNDNGNVADVYFKTPGLKHPIHGWIGVHEPVYEATVKAKETGETVTYRIESQRKNKVDRTLPYFTIAPNMEVAKENIRTILVGVNGILSSEAVTNPSKDPAPGGRYVDTDDASTPSQGASTPSGDLMARWKVVASSPDIHQNVLDAMVAQLVLAGYDISEVYADIAGSDKKDFTQPAERKAFSYEAPAYKMFNSDGRDNLGSSIVAAGVGIETLVHSKLTANVPADATPVDDAGNLLVNIDDNVTYFTEMLFSISDLIQARAYGEGFQVDRSAGSHTRIRGIIYDLVKSNGFPVIYTKTLEGYVASTTAELVNGWIAVVGREGLKRFTRAIVASQSRRGWGSPLPESMLTEKDRATRAGIVSTYAPAAQSEPTVVPKPAEAVTPEPVSVETKVETIVETPAVVSTSVPQSVITELAPILETVTASENNEDNIYVNHLTDEMVEGEDLAEDDTLEDFKQFLTVMGYDISSKADLSRVTKLLGYTFGSDFSKVKSIPTEMVEEFIDHYNAYGNEVFNQAVKLAVEGK
jgi:hypothetical protein